MVRGNSSGERERLGIGSANQVLQSNGTTESWQTLSTADSVLTTQGDILYQDASGLARLGQSTDGHVLTTKGAGANPVWAAAGGATANSVQATITSNFTTTSGTYVDITGLSITVPTITSGKAIIVMTLNTNRSTTGGTQYELQDDGVSIAHTEKAYEFTSSSGRPVITCCTVMDSDGSTVKARCYTGGGTLTIYGSSSDFTSDINCLGVG